MPEHNGKESVARFERIERNLEQMGIRLDRFKEKIERDHAYIERELESLLSKQVLMRDRAQMEKDQADSLARQERHARIDVLLARARGLPDRVRDPASKEKKQEETDKECAETQARGKELDKQIAALEARVAESSRVAESRALSSAARSAADAREPEKRTISHTIAIAAISAAGAVACAITALILNYRLFKRLERKIEPIESPAAKRD